MGDGAESINGRAGEDSGEPEAATRPPTSLGARSFPGTSEEVWRPAVALGEAVCCHVADETQNWGSVRKRHGRSSRHTCFTPACVLLVRPCGAFLLTLVASNAPQGTEATPRISCC